VITTIQPLTEMEAMSVYGTTKSPYFDTTFDQVRVGRTRRARGVGQRAREPLAAWRLGGIQTPDRARAAAPAVARRSRGRLSGAVLRGGGAAGLPRVAGSGRAA
jgi:hypothetical protein